MITYFIDTNVILRLIIKDNQTQYLKARKLFKDAADKKVKLYTSKVVFFEVKWVLASFYKMKKVDLIEKLSMLLSLSQLTIEQRPLLQNALALFATTSLSLEDCYCVMAAKENNCNQLFTFDSKLRKISAQYQL